MRDPASIRGFTVYRTLIRPKLEYGIEILHTATKSNLHKILILENTCLRIACGAMRSTSVDAIQQECGELPFNLRRKRLLLRYTTKLQSTTNNPATEILQDSWENHYGKFKSGTESVFLQTTQFHSTIQQLAAAEINNIPPWKRSNINTDTSLHNIICNQENTEIKKQLALDYIQQYELHLQIYTDGSQLHTGETGAAYYLPTTSTEIELKLPNNTSVINAELLAIKSALQFLATTDITNTSIVIFTDSQSAIHSINYNQYLYRTTETDIQDLNTYITSTNKLTIAWIPSHVGIKGNETADKIAKSAANKLETDIDQPISKTYVYNQIDKLIDMEWQQIYNNSTTINHYRTIQPEVSRQIKYHNKSRHKETIITRLRLGKCRLNHYLHKINRHPTGHCDHCHVPETIEHYLLHCHHAAIFKNLPSPPTTVLQALSSPVYINTIYNRTKQLQKQL
jgi:ribonuclease HI